MQSFCHHTKRPDFSLVQETPPLSISSFRELSTSFVSHFIGVQTYKKLSYHLLTIKQGSQENLRSYFQRFNAESLKVDILDKKFSITAFIAGFSVQSKDLMFSISKSPQASMVEMLAKKRSISTARKPFYLSRKTLPCKRRNTRARKSESRAPKDEEIEIDPHEGTVRIENGLQRDEATSRTAWAHPSPSYNSDIHLGNSPP